MRRYVDFTPSINLIAAVGKNGQLGLNGELPWANSEDQRIVQRAKSDMRFFKQTTTNGVIVVGYKTYQTLRNMYSESYWERTNRELVCFSREIYENAALLPEFIKLLLNRRKDIWVAGGADTYRRLIPYVDGVISINTIHEYTGPADTFFPFEAMPHEWQTAMSYSSV